jgi:hypothetical protein
VELVDAAGATRGNAGAALMVLLPPPLRAGEGGVGALPLPLAGEGWGEGEFRGEG